MWAGYQRIIDEDDPSYFSKYPRYVFIECLEQSKANKVFELYFKHPPFKYGCPKWNSEHDEQLSALVGRVIDCSHDWIDSYDTFRGIYTYFIDKTLYAEDMKEYNAFLKRNDVLILSEMRVTKW